MGISSARQNLIRRKRELRTIQVMLGMYCRGHHGVRGAQLCADCDTLFDYATRRLERCVFGDDKPTCANCAVHCYSVDKRKQVREVMQWAGPRMLLRHPLLAIFHLLDGGRRSPGLPAKPNKSEARAVPPEHLQNN